MKAISLRLSESLIGALNIEAKGRGISRSDVVRERLESCGNLAVPRTAPTFRDLAADLIGSVRGDGLPADLSSRKKQYLKAWGYGTKRDRR